MDKRSWPWKKKSSDKQAADKTAVTESSVATSDVVASNVEKIKQDSNKKSKYVQISLESYTHLTGLEDQVKSYVDEVQNYEEQVKMLEDEVQMLNEKLSESNEEITNKENLVKQHTKVAEEAVSGWEKAEAEAASLKNHLESVTLLKLTAEDRASHLDGALKECMRQIRNLKEENDRKLHELALNKTKLFDRMKSELEARIAHLDQELLTSAAENDALSRSLQERSSMLIHLNEEKSRAEAEIEHLKSNIDSCEREVNSLKYELHIAKKEMEIRNEEKNMSLRAAEVANKQHLEGVKKIAKLEAECQRLRGLVKKKLPGPAALAQMKIEVENLGREYGEPRLKRSPAKPPTPHSPQSPEFPFDNVHKYVKENELLTVRLLTMEEETKMLKEALANRNSELQALRSVYAQAATKLHSLEAQRQDNGACKTPGSNDVRNSSEGFHDRKASTPSSTSVSEDENVNILSPNKSDNASHLDLMDDFLEMEKLAYQSNESNLTRDQRGIESRVPSTEDSVSQNSQLNSLISRELRSKISKVLELISKEHDHGQVVDHIRLLMQDALSHLPVNDILEAANGPRVTSETKTLDDSSPTTKMIDGVRSLCPELEIAVSQIHGFLKILRKEAKVVSKIDGDVLDSKLDMFSSKYGESIDGSISLPDFVLEVSDVLSKASQLHFSVVGFKGSELESVGSDFIDKIALSENKTIVNSSPGERFLNGCSHFSDSAFDPDMPNDGNPFPTSETKPWKCSLEEFEQLKMEKENLASDVVRISESLENTKSQLLQTEQVLAEVKSQLASAQKCNGFVETQLKCMTESYKSLEKRAEELEAEVNLLQGKIQSLENELQGERSCHEETLKRCNDLQEQIKRIESSEEPGNDDKTSQEKELASAAEKLAECQETIYLLGKQLKALRPQAETNISPDNVITKTRQPKYSFDGELTTSLPETNPSSIPTDLRFNAPFSSPSHSEVNDLLMKSPLNSKNAKHRPSKSSSSFASFSSTAENQARGGGFSRFFSAKGKNG